VNGRSTKETPRRWRREAEPSSGSGRLRRVRRNLDTPWRAILGALIVTVSTVGLFRAADAHPIEPATPWTVATRRLAPGTVLRRSDLRTLRLDLTGTAVAAQAFPRPATVVGDILRAPLAPGELVQRSDLAQLSAHAALGSEIISLPIERAFALNGDLRAGEHVRLVILDAETASRDTEQAPPATAVVLAVGRSSSLLSGHGTVVVTAALSNPSAAEELLSAARRNDVAVLLPVPSTSATEPGVHG